MDYKIYLIIGVVLILIVVAVKNKDFRARFLGARIDTKTPVRSNKAKITGDKNRLRQNAGNATHNDARIDGDENILDQD